MERSLTFLHLLHVTRRAHLSWTTRVATRLISFVCSPLLSPSHHHLSFWQVSLQHRPCQSSFPTRFPPLRSACTTRSSLPSIGPLTAGWEPLNHRATSLTRNLTWLLYRPTNPHLCGRVSQAGISLLFFLVVSSCFQSWFLFLFLFFIFFFFSFFFCNDFF